MEANNERTNVSSRNGNSAVRRVLQEDEATPNPSTSSPVASSPPRVPGTPTQRVSGITTQGVSPGTPIRVRTLHSHWGNSPTNNENVVEIPSKKRKSTTPKSTPSKRTNRNATEPLVFEHEDDDTDMDKLEEAVDPFSIHRLNLDKLRSNSIPDLSEEKLVEQLMKDINSTFGKDSNITFEKRIPRNHSENQSDNDNNFNFIVVTYVQKITQRDKFLRQLQIYETVQRVNNIVFYIRSDEIFAITTGQSWPKIQDYCCRNFPYIISGRIASREGSYQESLKPLTGNVIMQKTTKKIATLFDQLSNIRYNSTKEIRSNASIFWLKEFKHKNTSSSQEEVEEEENPSSPSSSAPTSTSSSTQRKIKLTLGMAYLRIQKQMKLQNVPELLDHFSKICRNEETFSFPSKIKEIQHDDFQKITPAPNSIFQEGEEHILSIFYKFIHNERQDILKEFELCDKHVEDFYMSSNFTLKYNGDMLENFPKIPLVIDVFRALKRKCEQLTKAKDFAEFQSRFSNVKLEFELSDGNIVSRKLSSLIGCEIIKGGNVYMKSIGMWFELREGFHYEFQQMFHELLNKDGLLLSEEDPGYLKTRWNQDTMPFLKDYVNSYESEDNFFIPPQSQSSSSSRENESRKNKFIFDLMQVNREENGHHSIFIYHVFPSFDTKIRGASTRLEMFLETLKQVGKKEGSEMDDDNDHNYDSMNLSQSLSDVYSSQSSQDSRFVQLFPSFEIFRQTFLEHGKVTFVAAFRTSQENVVAETHPFMEPDEYIAAALDSCLRTKRSLNLEKNLQFSFNIENIQVLILNQLSQSSGDKICAELDIPPEGVASAILDKLLENRWCKNKEGQVEIGDKQVCDKLLTLKNSRGFRLFKNDEVNEEIFELLRPHFITQFPGIFHKLECVIMHDSTVAHSVPRLNFKIMGIKDADE
ncbi:unnamed protein product [Orchesella dallaii]|uniref:Uncharacterized protein n=1 Tax=Orchesella dallaii TaxID=48710 RepID=A0ABP1Q0N2_9HEXA